jgi:hypothetical protein
MRASAAGRSEITIVPAMMPNCETLPYKNAHRVKRSNYKHFKREQYGQQRKQSVSIPTAKSTYCLQKSLRRSFYFLNFPFKLDLPF